MANLALSLLFYPGLALALILALVFGWLTEGRVRLGWLRGAAWGSLDGLLSLASILLAALTLALLPWPLHPAAGWAWAGRPADRRLEPEPRGMAVLTVVLLAICLGIGLYPQPLLATINEAIRGLTFIQPL